MVAALVAAFVVATPTSAQPPQPPAPEPHGLRLDEAPELLMLEPFRHASGRSPSARIRWARGPYGEVLKRSLFTLDWEGMVPVEVLEAPGAPINPQPRPQHARRHPAERSALDDGWGWPFVSAEFHWFAESTPPRLQSRFVPEWLARLDPHYAHLLVTLHGCAPELCSVGASFPAFAARAIGEALDPPVPATPWWECREREARIMRYGLEQEVFVPLRCDGSVPPDALEKLSLLARPPGAGSSPSAVGRSTPGGRRGEWAPDIRLLHPRLLWVLHRLSQAYPWKGIYLYSGYRPSDAPVKPGTHRSNHAVGRALDLKVDGVTNEALLAFLWSLPDVGLGYYPNHPFVHVDVRVRGSGKGVWVDDSGPGEPSRFVAEWPGVVERGAVIYEAPDLRGTAPRP